MITLHHVPFSRSTRVLWLLEELALPYTAETLAFKVGNFGGDDYSKIHPLNRVPALRDGEMLMYESIAILQYLLDTYGNGTNGLRPNVGDADYGPYLQWLHYGESTLAPLLATLMRQRHFLPVAQRSPIAEAQAVAELENVLTLLEAQLADHDYVLARGFSLADISIGYCLLLMRLAKAKDQITPRLDTYWQHIKARESWIKASSL